MKEKLYTIELNNAVAAQDECLFCWLERKLEQEALEFVLGSSYMESDVREQTSRKGFCRHHTKMMFDYGNTLGNAWILKSRMEYVNREWKKQLDGQRPQNPGQKPGGGLLGRFRRPGGRQNPGSLQSPGGLQDRGGSDGESVAARPGFGRQCYICERMQATYGRMLDTFVYLLRSDKDFGDKVMQSNGFCLRHFPEVTAACEAGLSAGERDEWLRRLNELMGRNLERIQADIDWLIEKYDYRNKDADWKTSRDAVQRTMQKLVGGHPSDPAFRCKK